MKTSTQNCKQNRVVFFGLIILFLLLNWNQSFAQGPISYAPTTVPDCMKTQHLFINTGFNYKAGTPYLMNENDAYWSCIAAPSGYNIPMCAIVWDNYQPPGWGICCASSRAISVVQSNGYANINSTSLNPFNCHSNTPYTFRRKIWVDRATSYTFVAILSITLKTDDKLDEVRCNGTVVSGVFTGGCHETGGANSFNANITLQGGENTLDFDIINRDLGGGGTSRMALDIEGGIDETGTTFDLVRNEYYTCNASLGCITPNIYIEQPICSGTCIPFPANTGPIQITNFNSNINFTYTTSPSQPISATGVFTGTVGTTYTITVTDALGCTATSSTTIFAGPTITVTPPVQCIVTNNPSTTGPITYSSNGGTGPFDFTLQPSTPPPTSLSPGPNTIWQGAGTYTIQVMDANGCTSTGVSVINEAYVHATTSDPNNEICIGDKINLIATGNGGTYYWAPLNAWGQTITGVIPPLGTTTYQVTVTAANNNCTATNTVTVIVHPLPVVTITSNNAICNPQYTATSNTGPATYSWGSNGSGGFVGNPYVVPYQVPPISSGNINVIATDAFGCIGTANTNYVYNPFCCNQGLAFPTNSQTPSHLFTSLYPPNQVYHGNTASQIIQHFNMGSTITTNDNIIMDGNIIIDVPISFLNCPNILLTYQTQIKLNPDVTLNIESSTMKAFCDLMWKGIFADVPSEKVRIYNSKIMDMTNGVEMRFGAQIDCEYSRFLNNSRSIYLLGAPAGYSDLTGCKIVGNYFGMYGTYQFMYPLLGQKGEFGVFIERCKQSQVGIPNLVVTDNNRFEGLFNGIFIQPNTMLQTEIHNFYNNEFKNIKAVGQNPANWVSFEHRGAGIYMHWAAGPNTASHMANILCNIPMLAFDNCDKAVCMDRGSATIIRCGVDNSLMGFMFTRADGQKYDIHYNNAINNTNIGMEFDGDVGGANVYENTIFTKNTSFPFGTGFLDPIGITVNYNTPANAGGMNIYQNRVLLNSSSGFGYIFKNTNAFTNVKNNYADLTTTSAVNGAGYSLSNCKATILRGNSVTGNITLLSTINKLDGMRISSSKGCEFTCNHFKMSRIGMHVISDCSTTPAELMVKGNDFNAHGNAMRFEDLGSFGTFGDIGNISPVNDNGNVFANSALAGFGILRIPLSNAPPFNGKIYTNSFTNSFSGPNPSSARYFIQPIPVNSFIYQCPTIISLVAPSSPSIDLDEAMDIIGDSIVYPEFDTVARWLDDRRLYEAIAGDSTVILTNADLATFYGNIRLLTRTDEIVEIDRLIGSLSDTAIILDSAGYMQRLEQIENINNSIEGNNNIDLNEKIVNQYYLKWTLGGINALTASEQNNLEALAMSCPFINGTSVYKARTIYASINAGIDFDDLQICHGAGVYKNGNGTSNEVAIDPKLLDVLANESFALYPNPASTQITIDYALAENEEGKIIFYDLLGRECLTINLSSRINRVTTSINMLHNGVYLFRYYKNGVPYSNGKLIKE